MKRIVKTAAERREEIVRTARALFAERGYGAVSVESIIRQVGIAKGTFYHHFPSKEAVLEALVETTLDGMIAAAEQVVADPSLDALTKMAALLGGSSASVHDTEKEAIVHSLHLPANRELHERTNLRTILRLSPLLARIVEQGNTEKVWDVRQPLETVQLLLSGSQFLLDGGLFVWSDAERAARLEALQTMIERTLGAERGSFGFIVRH